MDFSTVIDWAIQEFKKLSGSTILSVISIFIAVSVFRFNKKMGYSKLSVLPIVYPGNQEPESSSLDFTYHLWHMSRSLNLRGLPIDISEKEFYEIENGKIISDKRFMPKLLTIKLKNKGELASTNVKIVLIFKSYGSKIKYAKKESGKDKSHWKFHQRKVFSKQKIIVKVPYMGADDEKEFTIVYLREQFRESELILCKIKANGHNYFKEKLLSKIFNRVVINHHVHPYLSDSSCREDVDDLLGLDYEEGRWIDPHKRHWIGDMIWGLRKLFAEWLK